MNENEEKSSKKQVVQSVLLFILYITVFCFLIRYVAGNADMMAAIASAPGGLVAVGLVTTAISVILTACLDITCAKVYGIKLTFADATVFTFIASAINLVMPLQLGSVVKAVYYKKKMQLSYSRYVSILSGTVIISLMITFIIFILSLFYTMVAWNVDKKYVLLISAFFLIGLAAFAAVLCLQDRVLKIVPLKKYTVPVMTGFFEIFNTKRAILLCSAEYLLSMVLGGIRFVTIFMILGVPAGFVNGMLYYGLYRASSFVTIIPGNIGIGEAIVGVMNMILGADFDAGVTTVLINRIYYYIVALLGAGVFAIPAWHMFNRETRHAEDR